MTLVRQIFRPDRDPTRRLNEVVNAEEPLDVRMEIDEYVFTDHTREYLRTIIDGVLDTSRGNVPDVLRGWIAGFFGSGKSHFLKLSAALLENRPLDGASVPALQYLVQRHDLDLPWERLAREFKIKAVTVNLALALGGGPQARRSPLLYRLASEINRAAGLSAVPHVAGIERGSSATRSGRRSSNSSASATRGSATSTTRESRTSGRAGRSGTAPRTRTGSSRTCSRTSRSTTSPASTSAIWRRSSQGRRTWWRSPRTSRRRSTRTSAGCCSASTRSRCT
jgi:hypothetical protein